LLAEVKYLSAVPWTVAVLLILLLLRRERKLLRTALEWVVLGLGNIVLVTLVSSQSTVSFLPIVTGRYLVAALPYFVMLNGVLVWLLFRWRWPAGLLAFVVLVGSNISSLNINNWDLQWLLPAYVKEVHNRYPTSIAAVSAYLTEHARQDDLVFVVPEYFNWPLIFHAGEKVRLCCFLDEQSPIFEEVVKELNAPLSHDEHSPDWVVVFGLRQQTPSLLRSFARFHGANRETAASEYQLVERLEVYWAQTQRPELPWHSFGPKTDFDPKAEGVYIYRRTGPGFGKVESRGRRPYLRCGLLITPCSLPSPPPHSLSWLRGQKTGGFLPPSSIYM
jgi:membrane-bound metal-dependent hydrolase YbcI (DUF457 family)